MEYANATRLNLLQHHHLNLDQNLGGRSQKPTATREFAACKLWRNLMGAKLQVLFEHARSVGLKLKLAVKTPLFWIIGIVILNLPVFLFIFISYPSVFSLPCKYSPSDCSPTGRIFIDSPEIYTRERLVNDRFVQDAWLRNQLQKLEEIEFSPQIRRKRSEGLDIVLGDDSENSGAQPQNEPIAKSGNSTALVGHSELDFQAVAARRDTIRQLVIENQLDDRHDLNGNTLYMVKFDVSVLSNSGAVAAIVEADLHPEEAPSPLAEFEGHIPAYIDIPYSTRGQPEAKQRLYQRWRNDEQRRLNEAVQKLFERFSSNNVSQPIAEDFLFFLRSSAHWMPRLPDDLATELSVEALKAAKDQLSSILSDEESWRILRPYINIFVVQRAYEIEKGVLKSPRFYMASFARRLCEFDKNRFCGLPEHTLGSEDRIKDLGSEITDFLRGEANLILHSEKQDIPYRVNFGWSFDTRLPPLIELSEKTSSIMALTSNCQRSLVNYLYQKNIPEFQRIWRHFSGRAEEVTLNHNQIGNSGDPVKSRLFQVNEFYLDLLGNVHSVFSGNNLIHDNPELKYWDKHWSGLVPYIANTIDPMVNRLAIQSGADLLSPAARVKFDNDKSDIANAVRVSCQDAASFLNLRTGFYNFVEGTRNQSQFSYATLPRNDHNLISSSSASSLQFKVQDILSRMTDVAPSSKLVAEREIESVFGQSVLIGYGSESEISVKFDFSELKSQLSRSVSWSDFNSQKLREEIESASTLRIPKVGWAIFAGAGSRGGSNTVGVEPTQKSLSALFSVPARWRHIKLGVNLGWIDASGKITFIEGKGSGETEGSGRTNPPRMIESGASQLTHEQCDYTHCFVVPLPENYSTLSEGAGLFGQVVRKPNISELDLPLRIQVRACRDAHIEIPGDRLWRNTAVTLDGQIADRITVLPNMRGVVAAFEPVRPHFQTSTSDVSGHEASLTVWTSEGKVEFPVDITVLPPLQNETELGRCIPG